MTCGLLHASYSLSEWQAVKLTFFAPCFHHLDTFSSHFVLSWGSLMFTSSGALLTVTHTKTLVVPVPNIPGSPLPYVCAPATYPLFTYTITSNQLDCITAKSLNTSIKCLASLVSLDPQDFSSESMSCSRYIHLQVRNSSWTHQTPKRLVIWPLHVAFMLASGGQTFSFKQCFPAVPYRDILWTHIYFVSCYSFSFPSKCCTSQAFVIKILIDCSVYIRHILYNTLYIIFFLLHPLSFPLW